MGVPQPSSASWYNHFRRRADRRGLYIAFALSAALHLSMVTVFTIVIHFPRVDIQYRDFTIVPVPVYVPEPAPVEPPAPETAATTPSTDQLALRGPDSLSPLAGIQLPTLEFAELERLRVRQESAQTLSRYDDLFQAPAGDSWSRFSRSLSGLGKTLSGLRLTGPADEETPLDLNDASAPGLSLRPAEGYEARIVWASEPKDRQLLFAPPVDALWNVDPATLARPIEVVLQVNELGKVVNVLSPNVDARELVDAVQATALSYRFEPLTLEGSGDQMATLRIQAAHAGAAP